ncbi:hypothetical protein EV286_107544 [Rhizobium sp. BK251]|nr:hypothetical protein EV286_107544 [Rhizobium sp. BK251]
MDMRPRMVSAEHQLGNHEHRIVALESWQRQSEIHDAKKEEQLKSMEALFNMRFTAVEDKLSSIGGTMTWIMRLVIGGLLMGVIAFAIKGGFYVP